MDEVFKVKWYLVEVSQTIVGVSGFPEVYYECCISTSPEPKKGYKLATIQRWHGGPEYNGAIEKAVGERLVRLHNEELLPKNLVEVCQQAIVEEPKAKRKGGNPRGNPNFVWPKGILRKREDGTYKSLKEAKEEASALQAASERVVLSEQPVQAETHEIKEKVQSQMLSTSAAFGSVVEEERNLVPLQPIPSQ